MSPSRLVLDLFYEALHFERKYYVATAITGALGLYLTVAGFAG